MPGVPKFPPFHLGSFEDVFIKTSNQRTLGYALVLQKNKMSISGKMFCDKICEIMPEITARITPELSNKTCEDPNLQPFVKWFCFSVGRDNVLIPEEIRLKKYLKKKNEWLDVEELDVALAEATKDCPELMKLLEFDTTDSTLFSDEMESEKDAYNEDVDYVRTLEESLQNLKKLELELDDDTEMAESELEKDRIRVDKLYADCIGVLEDFDLTHRQFFEDIERLACAYSESINKKRTPVVWTEVPLDLFIKQLEMHNDCLGAYVNKHFCVSNGQIDDSNSGSLTDGGVEGCDDGKIDELLNCQTYAITSKTDEIIAKVEETVYSSMASHVIDIYKGSSSIIPQSETQLQVEMAGLTAKSDLLASNVALLQNTQLEQIARQYAKLTITKILVNNGHARLARRKSRLEKLENLLRLARKKGHGHSDLLCMLMNIQLQKLKEIVGFITGGRHYLATEYSLSAIRSNSMQQQQTKFDTIMKGPESNRNVFNKILTRCVLGEESTKEDLEVVIRQCDELIAENKRRQKDLVGVHLDTKIANLEPLQDAVMSAYNAEIQQGPTNSFKPTPNNLLTRLEESTKSVREMQDDLNQIRTRMKGMNRKVADATFERHATLVWQLFLANPDELQSILDKATEKLERAHFVGNLDA